MTRLAELSPVMEESRWRMFIVVLRWSTILTSTR